MAWDEFLGGHDFDTRIAKMMAEQFDEKNSKLMDGQSVFESPRTMARLLKEAERYKVVLSANEFTPINVEALTNDIDFKSELSREDFETMCSDLLDRSVAPVEQLLAETEKEAPPEHALAPKAPLAPPPTLEAPQLRAPPVKAAGAAPAGTLIARSAQA